MTQIKSSPCSPQKEKQRETARQTEKERQKEGERVIGRMRKEREKKKYIIILAATKWRATYF